LVKVNSKNYGQSPCYENGIKWVNPGHFYHHAMSQTVNVPEISQSMVAMGKIRDFLSDVMGIYRG